MRMRPLKRLAWVLLAGFALGGCATKEKKSKPGTAGTPVVAAAPTPAPTPKPKRPFLYYVSPGTWVKSVTNLLPHKAKPPTATPPQLIGTIKMVNKEDKFVLIDGASFQGATAGDVLVCITNQKETANLKMSAMKNPPFLIADITNGLPTAGDKVYKP